MFAGITYPRIEQVGLQYPVPDEEHPGTPFLFAESFPGRPWSLLSPGIYTCGRGSGRRISVHPYDRTAAGALARWYHDSQLPTQCSLSGARSRNARHRRSTLRCKDGRLGSCGSSRRGTVVLRVNISPKATPGVVFIPMHFVEAAANVLTVDALDPQAKIPEYKACAVSIQIRERARNAAIRNNAQQRPLLTSSILYCAGCE